MDGRAIAEYRLALAARPYNAYFHNNLGLALLRQGDDAGAMEEFRRTIALDPGHAGGQEQPWHDARRKGPDRGGDPPVREAVRLQPDFVNAHLPLARLLSKTGAARRRRSTCGKRPGSIRRS